VGAYVTRRLAVAVVQILVVATLVFAFLHLLPGDPVMTILGSERSIEPEQVAAVRHSLGLDQPLPVQYFTWVQQLVRLDLGTSLVDNTPVQATIGERFPRSLELVFAATVLAVVVAIPMGVMAALRRNRAPDILLSGASALGISLPVYVTGLLLVLLFGVTLRWLPTQGYVEFTEHPLDHLLHLLLPAIVLAFGLAATVTRMTRSSLLEVLNQDYVRTARAKGVHERSVVYGHAVRNALVPVVTVVGVQIGALVGGAVLVEYIFNWPGMSTLLITAIGRRDYPTVQGVVLVASAFLILVNLAVDLLYGFIDPRIRRA
jgi:peptide/nickel transport system permease protein